LPRFLALPVDAEDFGAAPPASLIELTFSPRAARIRSASRLPGASSEAETAAPCLSRAVKVKEGMAGREARSEQ